MIQKIIIIIKIKNNKNKKSIHNTIHVLTTMVICIRMTFPLRK